jgi:hypothetical protein
LFAFQVTTRRSYSILGPDHSCTTGQSFGPVKMFVGPTELTPTRLRVGRLPGLGNLAVPPQGWTADLVLGQLLDTFQHPDWLTYVKVGADLIGYLIG